MDKQPALDSKICFIGAGSMAEAIARGLVERRIAVPERVSMINRSRNERLAELQRRYGVCVPESPEGKQELVQAADILVLAMKPKDVKPALAEYADQLHQGQFIVSVVAGLTISSIERLIGKALPVARTMPNTSSTIGYGATGISFSAGATGAMKSQVMRMFSAVGVCEEVEEPLLNAVTGVSGSGPAYIYFIMEAMMAAAEEEGLTAEAARNLTVQTVLGAARMVRETGETPAALRQKVTSPNGTTFAAIEYMKSGGLTEIVREAVHRASARAAELGTEITDEIAKDFSR